MRILLQSRVTASCILGNKKSGPARLFRPHSSSASVTKQPTSIAGSENANHASSISGEDFWKFFKKYGSFVVPFVVLTTTSITIINNEFLRYKLEDFFPVYVDFVRKYYGFEGENLAERRRMEDVIKQEKKAVTAIVYVNGRKIVVESLPGDQVYSDLVRNYGDDIAKVDFMDDPESPVDSARNASEDLTTADSDKFPAAAAAATALIGAWNVRSAWDTGKRSDSEPWSKHPERLCIDKAVAEALWSLPIEAGGGLKWAIAESALRQSLGFSFIGDRWQHVARSLGAGVERFLSVSGRKEAFLCRPLITEEDLKREASRLRGDAVGQRRTWLDFFSFSAPHSGGEIRPVPKEQVLQSIADLEVEILGFRRELSDGKSRREIDDIEADIRIAKDKIRLLKRKYINYFYYF